MKFKDVGQRCSSKVLVKDVVQRLFKSTWAWPLPQPRACLHAPWIQILAIDIIFIYIWLLTSYWFYWLLTLYWLFTGPGWEIDPVLWVLQIFVRNRFGRKYLVEIFGLNRFGRYLFWPFWTNLDVVTIFGWDLEVVCGTRHEEEVWLLVFECCNWFLIVR